MSTINDRIKQLVDYFCEGKNTSFANKIGVSEANVRNYIKDTEPKFNVIEKIAKNFEISFEWLIMGEGNMKKAPNMELVSEPPQCYMKNLENKVPQVITIDSEGRDNITLVPVQAQAGYLTSYNDPQFIATLPTYRLPGIANGTFRMFQAKGFSMLPYIHDKAYVVSEFVENWIKDIRDDRVYVVVTKEHGVVIKRLLNRIKKYGSIYCKSDNRAEYPSFSITPNEIQEIWECKVNIGFQFPNPADLYDRLNDLESEVMHLKEAKKLQ